MNRAKNGNDSSEWGLRTAELHGLLDQLVFTGLDSRGIPVDEGFEELANLVLEVKREARTVFFIGNGASASMASHFAADLAKNGRLHTEVFSDLSLITAISNDLSFDQVFAEPLSRRGAKGDLLAAISSSGNSPNILRAIEQAKELGVTVLTVTAMRPDNKARTMGDINLYVPAETYGQAESCHAVALHYWIDQIVDKADS